MCFGILFRNSSSHPYFLFCSFSLFFLLFSFLPIILTFASQEKTSILRLAVYVYDVINKVGMCGWSRCYVIRKLFLLFVDKEQTNVAAPCGALFKFEPRTSANDTAVTPSLNTEIFTHFQCFRANVRLPVRSPLSLARIHTDKQSRRWSRRL